jgi:hypothetical protein
MPDSWGPSPTDIAHAAHTIYHANTSQPVNGDSSLLLSEEEAENDDEDEEGDDELIAEVEEVASADEYDIVDSDSEGDLEYWDDKHVPSSPTLY